MSEAKATEPETRNLEDTTFTVSKVGHRVTVHNVVLSWRLHDYEQLRDDIMYHQLYESLDLSCTLRILKRSSALYLCVASKNIPDNTKAEFLLMREPTLKSVKKEADEITSGVYAAEFPRKSYFGPDLDSLGDDGTLTVSFKYTSDHFNTFRDSGMDDQQILCDFDSLCCDMRNLYFEAVSWDFLVHVGDYGFKTHKFMLSARSPYFNWYLKKHKDADSYRLHDFNYPGIFHEFLIYIYSGDLRAMDVQCMLHVHELAVLFEVAPLINKSFEYFQNAVDTTNCREVAFFAYRYGYAELKNIVVRFLMQQPGINVVEYFKEIEKEVMEELGAEFPDLTLDLF